MKTLPKAFGDAVQQLRQATEVSQEKFAASAGISRTYMSEIERGVTNVSLETIGKLAEELKVSLPELFTVVETQRTLPARKRT